MPKLPRIRAIVGTTSMVAARASSGSAGSQLASPPPIASRIPPEDRGAASALRGAREIPSLLPTQDLFIPGGRDLVRLESGKVLDDDYAGIVLLWQPVG